MDFAQMIADFDAFPCRYRINKYRRFPAIFQNPDQHLFTKVAIRDNNLCTANKLLMLGKKFCRNTVTNTHIIYRDKHFSCIIEQ
ncbi:Uncharacterised protein [Shigella sonnei]|nr:Uncharacterised protein [Shigella sonnei]